MIRNYLKIAYRNLLRYKFISFINLFGLTIGLTCCLLITAYVQNELSYDRHHEKADNIYRIARTFRTETGAVSLRLAAVSPPFGYYMPGEFPEITKMTRLLNYPTVPMRVGDKKFNEQGAFFADEHLFDVFNVNVLKGNPSKALVNPYSVMLTEETAKKYFGNEDPINKTIRLNSQYDFRVTGIFKSFPPSSHFHPGLLLSFNTLKDSAIYGEEGLRTSWGNNAFLTYIVLPDNYDASKLEAKFPAFLDKHMKSEYDGKVPSKLTSLHLQKLTDIHLYSHTDYEVEANGDITRVYIFSAIALFILLIACINYMNLSTARSALRSKEIGIRKVAGALKKELVMQFLSESVLVCIIATLLALFFTYLCIPFLNEVSGQALSISRLLTPTIITILVLTPFVVGILSGLYPALFMSSFQPIKTLKGIFKVGGSSISFRKALVVTQFSIGIILIITTVIVFQQLHFIQNKALGYDKEKVITLGYTNEVSQRYDAFRDELLQNSSFKDVTRSSRIPTGRLLDNMGAATVVGDSMQPVSIDLKYVLTDYDFASTFGISVLAGRYFSREYGTDSASFVLNEKAASGLGWTLQEAVGKPFVYGGNKGHIVGVLSNFHFESMHQEIGPIIMMLPAPSVGSFNNLSIKIAGNNIPSALSSVESTWKKYFPETPFDYTFLDDNFDRLYQAEQRQATLFTAFACIAIFIACLGLFGLSAFAISQRIKEIGVRKVLGANVSSIVTLLSKDFLKLVGLASLLAFPVAWIAMNNWLKDFAYRVSIAWWVFAIAAVAAAIIAVATISFQAIKAALANPVKALRSE